MPRIAEQAGPVTGGVDTHADVHVAAVVDRVGRVLGTGAFPATAAGYRAALAWMRAHGELVKVGVEGTGSYGAGLARYLAACGIEVAEVIRPNRQARRQRGKSDTADAVAAAWPVTEWGFPSVTVYDGPRAGNALAAGLAARMFRVSVRAAGARGVVAPAGHGLPTICSC
jgi:transposase